MILVDDRAGSKDLVEVLRKHNLDVSLTRLDFGDLAWAGNGPGGEMAIGVEYKSILDLCNSMRSGRLSGHQIPGMLKMYSVSYLLVCGIWKAGTDGALHVYRYAQWVKIEPGKRAFQYREVTGYLETLAQKGGVQVRLVSNETEAAHWIAMAYNWWAKPWDQHSSLSVMYNPNPSVGISTPSEVRRVAKELPGVGWERSGAVERAFPTIEAMILATEEEWRAVPGIGKHLAAKIWNLIRGVRSIR